MGINIQKTQKLLQREGKGMAAICKPGKVILTTQKDHSKYKSSKDWKKDSKGQQKGLF